MNTGSALARFTITLSTAVSEPVQVEWYTSDGTAKASVDYAANKGIVVFSPGETAKTVDILVYGRAVGTEDRSFYVEMLPPTNAILGASIGECIITVDTSGSTPVTAIIVPSGPEGDSAYQVWLNQGNTGTEHDFLDSLRPDPAEIAPEVAPLIDVGATVLTAEGTETLGHPDATTVKAIARRVAYAARAKVATVLLNAGDNLLSPANLTGDTIDFTANGFVPLILRSGSMTEPDWENADGGKVIVKSASVGDVLYAVQYATISAKRRFAWNKDMVRVIESLSLVDGASRYPYLQIARWRDDGDVRGWGAVGDGVTDDTAAINAAAAATTSLYLPEGDFLYKGSVITRDIFLTIRGAGLASTRILYRPDVAGVLFDHTHSPELRGVMTVSDLTVLTDLPAAGTAFKVTAILTSAPHQVNGQHDAIILNRVHVKQTGAGYWTHFLHAVNSGGNHLMLTSFDNSTLVAQADVSVIGVLLEATDARVSMIRTLSATDFYILRTSVAIKTISAGANPVESFYLHTGEVVGVGKAAYQHVGGVGAIMIVGVHSDVIEKVVDASRGSVLGARYVACDFGCGTNGGASSPSELFAFDYGELVAFSACTFTGIGSETTNPLRYVFSFSNTINGIGLYRFTVDGCVFRNFHHVYGLTNGVQNGVASGNVYAVIYDTICADTFGDTSIVLRDAYVCQTRNLVLTATASQEVTFPLPTKWYPGQLPFAQLVQSSPSGSDSLTVEYSFDTSDNTTAKFFIKGCTAARTVRFAFIASALGQSASS